MAASKPSAAPVGLWPAELPGLREIDAPERLWIPLSSHETPEAIAPLPPGTRVPAGHPLSDAPSESSHVPIAPVAGEIGSVRLVELTNGRSVLAVELIADSPAQGAADAIVTQPETRESLPDWIDHLRRCGVHADRRCSPDLIRQLNSVLSRPVDVIICTVLDTDAAMRHSAVLAATWAKDATDGVQLLAKISGARRSIIATEANATNKWAAPLRAAAKDANIRLIELANDYPQADPTLIIYSLVNRRLAPSQLPTQQGVLLVDAAAALSVGRARRGRRMLQVPLAIHNHITRVSNFLWVPIGTSLDCVFARCGIPDEQIIIRAGDLLRDHRITAGAIVCGAELIIHATPLEHPANPDPCIRTGWCIDICPTRVQPAKILEAAQHNDPAMAQKAGIEACIECGLCTYVCPSRLPLLDGIRLMRAAKKVEQSMTQMTVEQAMQMAVSHHEAGRFSEAEQIYRAIIERFPKHANAIHLLGVLAGQTGRTDLSLELIQRAISISPASDAFHVNLGNALDAAGRLDDAVAAYRAAIQLNPVGIPAYFNLGLVLTKAQRTDEAIQVFQKAVQLKPDYAEAHNCLGRLFKEKDAPDSAMAAFQKAIRYKLDFAEAYNGLGNVLSEAGKIEPAIANYKAAIALNPKLAEAHNNLGAALHQKGEYSAAIIAMQNAMAIRDNEPDFFRNIGHSYEASGQIERAIEAWQKAIALNPTAETYSDLCMGLYELDELDAAEAAVEMSMRLKPDFPSGHGNRGALLLARGKFEEAIAAFQTAIALDPDEAKAHLHLSIVQLLLGDFERGLIEYEWRWKIKPAVLDFRQWRGEPLNGKTILLHCEQGLGDTIQFVRYAPMLAARGARVILSCQPTLMRLFKNLAGVDQVISVEDPLPPFDERCTLLSLPLAFGTRIETIPAPHKYIEPDPQLTDAWQNKRSKTKNLRVGLTWAGSPGFRNDRRRSIRLEQFSQLASLDNIDFYSLQKGEAARQPSPIPNLIHPEGLNDFADTAALIANLDLVITVDTAVAHLAGAMGKPVWVLIPFIPDWRWMLEREDTSWYPSMRLFRQKTRGDWAGVIQSIAAQLSIQSYQ